MTPADRAQAAQRLLDDPLVKELWASIEHEAIEAMLIAPTDEVRREARDTVGTIRKLRVMLGMTVTAYNEAKRPRQAVA